MLKKMLIFALAGLLCAPALADTYPPTKDFSGGAYPKINVSGQKKWSYRDADVKPAENYFEGLTHLGGFSPTSTGSPWEERLSLSILTQLTKKLTLTYDISQAPESPDSYGVNLTYDDKHQLVFGDFGATFSGNEFASATKSLNGMMLTSSDNGYDMVLVPSAKLKSYIQGLTSQQGNNTRGPYKLGSGSIVEGSERIELNGIRLDRGKDYIIDYMEGQVTFNHILTENDEFTYSFEYTNVTDLFFPTVSKKDFVGFQGRFQLDPDSWTQKNWTPKRVILDHSQRFPTDALTATKEAEARDIMAEEDSGRFQLKHYPVVSFSETLIFKGAALAKNRDYLIDYDRGSITLLTNTLPNETDPLLVNYSYKKTDYVVEYLPGEGGRGPYPLTHNNLVPQSEEIYINDRLVTRDYDYLIDYQNGRIIFNFEVPSTASLRCKYRYAAMEAPPLPPPPELPQDLTVGVVYLKESAKPGLGFARNDHTTPQPIPGTNIINNNNTIYTQNYPLVPPSEGGQIIISDGSRTLTYGVDYVVPSAEADPATGYARVTPQTKLAFINDRLDLSDGWDTGTIKILTTIEATAEVTMTYTHYKSVIGRFTGTGNGGRGPYYIRNYTNIIPGTEKIEVWKTGEVPVAYVRNSSFEADAGDRGYSINYYEMNPYITFNQELSPDQNFSIYFQYVPPSSPVGNAIAQEIYGLDADYSLGDVLTLNLDFAHSRKDQLTITVSTVESAVFTPPTNQAAVTVHNSPAVVEGTEKIYINGHLRNRDIDYIIDYISGTINFYYITLTSADAVTVQYEYPDPGGIATTGEKSDDALKYGLTSTVGDLSMSYNESRIGFDFIPMGNTSIGQGSSQRAFSADYLFDFHSLTTHFDYLETNAPQSNSRDRFVHNYSRNYSASFNPFGLAGMTLNLRNQETRGDPETAGGAPTARSELNAYSGSLSPPGYSLLGVSYGHSYDGSLSDSRDFLGNTFSRSKSFHTSQDLSFNRVRLGLDYAFSEPYSLSNYQTSQETVTDKSTTRDTAYDMSLDLTFPWIRNWTSYGKLIKHEELVVRPERSYLETRNYSYYTTLTPINMLNLRQDYSRQETSSVLVEGKNPMTETNSTTIKLVPLSNVSTGWDHTENATVHDSGRESSGRSDSYSVGWGIYSSDNFSLGSAFAKGISTSNTPSGSQESVRSDTDTFSQTYTITYTPRPELAFSPSFTQDDSEYRNEGEAPVKARSQTGDLKISYTPTEVLSSSFSYSLKTTSTPDTAPANKENLNASLSYQVFDWGTLVFSQEEEHNMGEVQAGGSLPELNFHKISRSLGLNLSIPQDNPIVTSLVFSLTYKWVTFDNRLPGRDADDFEASLLQFESALNF